MNTSSPNPVRVTPAFYLTLATLAMLTATVYFYLADMGIAYCITLPTTVALMLVTGDTADKYRKRNR